MPLAASTDSHDSPHLGIFWYDEHRRELFGVFKMPETDIEPGHLGRRVYPQLHQNVWGDLRNPHYDAYGDYVPDDIYPDESGNPMRELDYTLIPRGRVFSDDRGYQVYVGNWFFDMSESDQEHVRSLVLDEFNLWEIDTDFLYGFHWNIEQGWGE